MSVLDRNAPALAAVLLVLSTTLASVPASASSDAIPGGFLHEDGWRAARFVLDHDDGLPVELHTERIGFGYPTRGGALVALLDAEGAVVGEFSLIGGAADASAGASAAGLVEVRPALPQTPPSSFIAADFLLAFHVPRGEYTVVLVAAADGEFGAGVSVFVPEANVLSTTSGSTAAVVGEEDFGCVAAAAAGVPGGTAAHATAVVGDVRLP